MNPKELRDLRRSFSDICRGYSKVEVLDKQCFIKHFSHHDQVNMDVVYEEYFERAKSKKLYTESEKLEFAIKEELSWKQEDEDFIKKQNEYLEALVNGKKHLTLQKQIDNQDSLIEGARAELNRKLYEREKILGVTCEVYAKRKVDEYYVAESFFFDSQLTLKCIDQDDLETEDEVLGAYLLAYNNNAKILEESFIKLLSIQEFFQIYWSMADGNIRNFFGLPVSKLTYFQINLSIFGNIFTRILKDNPNIPEDLKSNPDKLIDYANSSQNMKDSMQRRSDSDSFSQVGAKKSDYEKAGVSMNDIVSPAQLLKKKGKKRMSQEEIIKILNM